MAAKNGIHFFGIIIFTIIAKSIEGNIVFNTKYKTANYITFYSIMYIINKYNHKSIVVNSEDPYAECDDSNNDVLKPYCEYENPSGHMQREDCYGQCRREDVYNYWGNVSFCCEFNHGQRYPDNGEKHCCDYNDICRDNVMYENDCNSM